MKRIAIFFFLWMIAASDSTFAQTVYEPLVWDSHHKNLVDDLIEYNKSDFLESSFGVILKTEERQDTIIIKCASFEHDDLPIILANMSIDSLIGIGEYRGVEIYLIGSNSSAKYYSNFHPCDSVIKCSDAVEVVKKKWPIDSDSFNVWKLMALHQEVFVYRIINNKLVLKELRLNSSVFH